MIKAKGVVHLMIPVTDTAVSRRFYCDLLGFRLIADHGHLVFCKCGPDFVVLGRSETRIEPNVGDDHRIHQAFRVEEEDYDASLSFLRSNGVKVFKEEDRDRGVFVGRSAYFHDPDRNVIELYAPRRSP